MNNAKRKKIYTMELAKEKAVTAVQEKQATAKEEVAVLPIALKELPEEQKILDPVPSDEQPSVVEKKKITKFKKVVEEDKTSDVQ